MIRSINSCLRHLPVLILMNLFLFFLFVPMVSIAQDFHVKTIDNLVDITVMEVVGDYNAHNPDGSPNAIPRQKIAQEFFKTHPDDYDFIVIFTNFDFLMPEKEVKAFYLGVKNDIQGLGIETFDNTDLYGSKGRIQGTIDMGNIAKVVFDPLNPEFTSTMTTLAHEMLHRWAAYVRFKKDGGVSSELLGRYGYHWSFLLDTQGSLLYGNRWRDNGNGTFTSLPGFKYFSPLDLYLMGLVEKSHVPPMLLIENPSIDPQRLPGEGVTIDGTPHSISIEDIIAAEGERIPGAAVSQKEFKAACILITRPATFTEDTLYGIRAIMKNWVMWVSGLTDGRALVRVDSAPLADIPTNPGTPPLPYDPRTAPPEVNEGVAWLVSHQEEDGRWEDVSRTSIRDTAEAILALTGFPGAKQSVSAGIQWLTEASPGNTDYLARKIESISYTGGVVSSFVTELLTRQNSDGGWGSERHYVSNPTDTSCSVRALAVSGSADRNVIERAIGYLKAAQNPDNGWGSPDRGSSIQTTANVLSAFNSYRSTFSLEDEIQRGIAWLMARQNPDGGFGCSQSSIYETAIAVLILKEFNVSSDITGHALDYILNLQSKDGSWYESPYQTAIAVRAVWRATVDPDLSISTPDITFTPPSIKGIPADITVNARIQNLGITDVSEATVALYDGAIAEANKVGMQKLAFPGKLSIMATFSIKISDGNSHRFYIAVDPENLIRESSESNNTALKVLYPETTYDFEILPGDILVVPNTVDLLQTVNISTKVSNRGTTNAYNVQVRYFVTTPDGPIEIATLTDDIPAGGSIERGILWKASKAGENLSVIVQADPANAFTEISEQNNTASAQLLVRPSNKPNLAISHKDIVITPSPAMEAGTAHIAALIKNTGFSAAENVEVRFSKGVPGKDGIAIGGQSIASLGGGEETTVVIDWTSIQESGDRIITVQVDPDNIVQEISEEDNSAFVTLQILSLPDLAISTNSITFTPPAPKEGDEVSIQVTVQNAGKQGVTKVTVTASEGSTVIGSKDIPSIPGNSQAAVTLKYDTTGKSGAHEVKIVVDPENAIHEQSEDNNTASRTFGVQDADLWLTERYISPNNDGVQDSTQFFFRLKTSQTVRVCLRNEKNELVRTYTGSQFEHTKGDTVTWDGLDDKGRVVADGEYQFQVINETNQILASLPVIVDNNRSPLTKAIGTDYLLKSNLTCMLPDIYDWEWFPDESGIGFSISTVTPEYPRGLYAMAPDGEDIIRLVPWEWSEDSTYRYLYTYSLSPDGEKIAFILEKYNKKKWKSELSQLWVVDRYGQNLVMLDQYDLLKEWSLINGIYWSPDGSYIAYKVYKELGSSEVYQIWVVKPDGTGKKKIDELYTNYTLGYAEWSPDSKRIAYYVYYYDVGNDRTKIRVTDTEGNQEDIFDIAGYIDIRWIHSDTIVAYGSPGIWLVDASGNGNHIKVSDHVLSNLSIQPNSKGFAFLGDRQSSVEYCDDGGTCRTLYKSTKFYSLTDLRWSPNGTKLAFVDYLYEKVEDCNYNAHLVVLDMDTGEKRAFQVSAGENPCSGGGDSFLARAPRSGNGVQHKYVSGSLRWLADDVSLIAQNDEGAFAINTEDGELTYLPIKNTGAHTQLRVSPLSRYLTYYQPVDPKSVCYERGNYDLWAMSSLLNLTADLRLSRKGSAVLLKGTAADLNFAGYKLEYADIKSPATWNQVTPPSNIPVINDIFTSWAPPYKGTFLVRLTVWDKAGNVAWDRKRVSWGLFSKITNLYKTEDIFSPNGDDIKDTVELHYRALEPVHLEFFISDEAGQLVRTFLKDHPAPIEDHITWDGRDERGRIVPDGMYMIKVFDYEFFVHVDNTPTEVSMGLTPIEQDPENLRIFTRLLGRAVDLHMKEWVVEYGTGENPQEWVAHTSGSSSLQPQGEADNLLPGPAIVKEYDKEDIIFLVGKRFRITAEDLAGNKSTKLSDFLEELILIYNWDGIWYFDTFGKGRVKDGVLISFERDAEGQIETEPTQVLPPEYTKPGLHRIWGFETIRLPLKSANVQYRKDMKWVDYQEVEPSLTGVLNLEWDNTGLDPERVDAARLKAVDEEGIIHYSNAILLQPIFAIHVSCKETYARQSLLEELVLLTFQVKSENDTRYPEWTDYKVYDIAKGDTIPTGIFPLPLPPDLQAGVTYQLRMIGISKSETSHESAIASYPPSNCLKLKLEIEYSEASNCNALSPGQAVISAKPKDYVGDIHFQALSYYIQEAGEYKLLRRIDLTKEAWGSAIINTTRMPEGIYPIKAMLEYIQYNTPQEIAETDSLVIDRVLPQARITFPASSAKLCPIKIQDPCGDWFAIYVEGIGTDNHAVKRYALSYCIGENPAQWIPAMKRVCDKKLGQLNWKSEPIEDKGSVQGRIGAWDVTELRGETFSLMLKVWDIVGNLSCYTTTFSMDTAVHPTIATDKRLFSPNGDGVLDDLQITYSVDEYATINIKAFKTQKDVTGAITIITPAVREIVSAQALLPGAETTSWDGKDNAGATVPDGLYRIIITATDACGNAAEKAVDVEVDNTPPTVVITYPRPGDPLGIIVEPKGTAQDLHFASYQLIIEENSALLGQDSIPRKDAILGRWNTYGLEGSWNLKLTATDTAGNQGETTVTIDLGERKDLIKDLKAEPALFSPNKDNKLDNTTVHYELAYQCDVTIELLDYEKVLKRTYTAPSLGAGAHTYAWNGADTQGQTVPDGQYTVRLIAALTAQPEVKQSETVTCVVDTIPPNVDIQQPLDRSYLRQEAVTVHGTITDTNLSSYSITYRGDGGTGLVDEANQGRVDYTFGTIMGLPEGAYTLDAKAVDKGENTTQKGIVFTIDRTPPKLTLLTPVEGDLYGFNKETVPIKGTIEEKNLGTYAIRYGAGADPAQWSELLIGDTVPATQDLYTWKVGKGDSIADGLYTLSLYAKDKAGWEAETRVRVTVDNTPPEVSISSPQEGDYVKEATDIKGTAFDMNLDAYSVEISEGDCASAYKWTQVKKATAGVKDGVLAAFKALPPDGGYCLKVIAIDKLGNKAEARHRIIVDTQPPAAPVLSGKVENKKDARLTWTKNAEPDLAGYNLYRNGNKVNASLITETFYLDQGLDESAYAYTVKAVDKAGWESEPSNTIELRIDATPPVARISSPQDNAFVSDVVDIKGTAYSADDFKEYRVSIGKGGAPTAWTLIRRSPIPTPYDTLAQWDTIGLAEGEYAIKLEAEDLAGNIGVHQVVVRLDNTPPAAPVLLTAVPDGSNVTLSWQANTEPDLAGYLLFRNDQLANVSGTVVGDLKPYLITGTSYTDTGLPDGAFTYYLEAMDQAGNESEQSNTKEVKIDTHPPKAQITEPANGHRFDTTIMVKAESPDLDIAAVQFQYKKTTASTWTNMSAEVITQPFVTYLDPQALGWTTADYGDYNLQAKATDTGGRTDPSPSMITITYAHVTAPEAPQGLKALTDGANVALSWEANTEPDLAGYNVYMVSEGMRTKLNTQIVKQTTYTQKGLADGLYAFEVAAVDIYNNEGASSEPAQALIYAPQIIQPYTPVDDPQIQIHGTNAVAKSQVEIFVDSVQGPVSQGKVSADEKGNFSFTITLSLGENRIAVQATDAKGNRSRVSDAIVIVYNEAPAAPTGLEASVSSHDVALKWNPNTETDLAGYNLYRDKQKLNAPLPIITGTTNASSNISYSNRAFDRNPATYWYGNGAPLWWEIKIPAPELINRIEIEWGGYGSDLYAGKDYEVRLWSGNAWITKAKVMGNQDKINSFDFRPSYRTDKIRIYITDSTAPNDYDDMTWLTEVRLFKDNLIIGTSYTDKALLDGKYAYHITAVDSYGFESIPSEKASAEVGDVIPPAAPIELTAAAAGTDINLSWSANAEPDLAGYNVYKNTAQGWVRINGSLVTETTYTDANLPNGTYTYRLTALDMVGNESSPSNEASASVYVEPSPRPTNVIATVIPEGRSLKICWEYAGAGVAGYNIYRSTTPGGPYVKVNQALIIDTCFLDTGLVNGLTYYYVVTAVDAYGKESGYSDQISAVPADLVAPEPPILFYPTISGIPFVLDTATANIVGAAEPGAMVQLFKKGLPVGKTMALEKDISQNFTLRNEVEAGSLSPDAKTLVYMKYDTYNWYYCIWLQDLATGNTTQIVSDALYPFWSPDGARVTYEFRDENWNNRIGIYDKETGATMHLTNNVDVEEFSPSWDRKGDRIAFVSSQEGVRDVWIKELDTGVITRVTEGAEPDWVVLSPDGQRIAYTQGQTLYTVDLAIGASAIVDTQAFYEFEGMYGSAFAWSPDGMKLGYVSSKSGSAEIYLLDMRTLKTEQITETAGIESWLSWSPGGQEIVYSTYTDTHDEVWITPAATDKDGRLLLQADQMSLRYLEWTPSGSIANIVNTILSIVQPKGLFTFSTIPLEIGANTFHSTATDAAGNVSLPSDSITLICDPGLLPDLETLSDDVFIYPLSPIIGEQVTITALFRNRGAVKAEDVVAYVYVWDAAGALELAASKTIPSMGPFAEEQVRFTWDSQGKMGKNTVMVILDPDERIFEASETNNLVSKEFYVVEKEGVTLTTRLDSDQYPANTNVNISVHLHNSGPEVDGVLDVWVEDEAGSRVALVATRKIRIPYGAGQDFDLLWNTGVTYAGAYRVKAAFKKAATIVAESSTPFTIVPEIDVESSVITDKARYGPLEDVLVRVIVNNRGQNYTIPLLSVKITITPDNGIDLFSSDHEIRDLMADSSAGLSSTWNTGLGATGEYRAVAEVSLDGTVISSSLARFSVHSSVILKGTITATPPIINLGDQVRADYSVTNSGNAPASGIIVRMIVLDPETQANKAGAEEVVNLSVGETKTGQFLFSTEGYGLKGYTILLQGIYLGKTNDIASTSCIVRDGSPPTVKIISPAPGSTMSGPFDLAIIATDNASGVALAEYQIDAGTWLPLPATDPISGRYSTRWQPMQADEGPHTIQFRATDRAGNCSLPVSVQITIELGTPFAKLTGTLSITPDPVYRGQKATCAYTITNEVNKSIKDLALSVIIVDPKTGGVAKTLEKTITVPAASIATGNLDTSTMELVPQVYSAKLQVASPEAIEPRILAIDDFEVVQSIEVTETISNPINLLVWVNDKCHRKPHHQDAGENGDYGAESNEKPCDEPKPKECIRDDLLEKILAQVVGSYLIVYESAAFEEELRNPYYTDIMILGDHQPLTDHVDEELRERVYAGTGIISSLWLKHGQCAYYEGIFGVRYKGSLPGYDHTVTLVPSPITGQGVINAAGEADTVEALAGTTIAGWIEGRGHTHTAKTCLPKCPYRHPAIVLNQYGLGTTIYCAFDLGISLNDANYERLAALIKGSILHVHREPDTTAFVPYQLAPIDLGIKGLGQGLDMRITNTFPSELPLYDPTADNWIIKSPWTISMSLEPDQTTTIRYYALTPDKAGTYTIETEVGFTVDGVYIPYHELTVKIVVEMDAATLIDSIIAQLGSLSISAKDRPKVKNSITYLKQVKQRKIVKEQDVVKNINDILKAIESLLQIKSVDIKQIRLKLDTLLRTEQGMYYLFPES